MLRFALAVLLAIGLVSPLAWAEEHAELEGSFVYRCEDAKSLQGIDVMLFDHFKRLRGIETQVAGPKSQSALKLNSRARQIRW